MKPLHGSRGLLHRFHIERVFHPPYVLFRQCRAPGRQVVDVAARLGVVPGMKPRIGLLHRQDVDVVRQLVVQAQEQGLQRQVGGFDVQMRHLAQGVYPGIGAPGALQFKIIGLENIFADVHDGALHGAGIFLQLPAFVAGAFVF